MFEVDTLRTFEEEIEESPKTSKKLPKEKVELKEEEVKHPSIMFTGVNRDDIEWVNKLCTPHPIGCFIQKLRFTGKEALVTRRTYVLAERYRSANHATYARVKSVPGWKAVSVDCGHDVMVDDPDALAALLLQELGR